MFRKWILFDAMGVIFKVGDDTNELLVPYVQKINPNCGKEELSHLYMQASLGEITAQEFWELSCAADAADCIFVDDRDKNLIPARGLGMHVIRFIRDGSPCCLNGVPAARSFSNVLTIIQNLW